ncbi:MAG: hypothetical protein NC191_00465, partial [Muribaculaceae bacterium]|nr:hypothetical protein [Muribaculaceae bacterium]
QTAALNATYTSTNFGIRKTDAETCNVISNTFGKYLKNNLQACWNAIGFSPNVNLAFQKAMTDPQQCMESNGKKYYMIPAVGSIAPTSAVYTTVISG